MVLPGYKGAVYITALTSLAFSQDATTTSDLKTYSITNQAHRYWDSKQALTVEKSSDGTTWNTVSTGFTIQYVGGAVIFTAAQAAGTQIRVSGKYFPYSQIASASSVDIKTSIDVQDVSVFGDQWREKVSTLAGAEYSLTQWWVDSFYLSVIKPDTPLLLSAYTGANPNQRYDAWGFITEDAISIAIDNIIQEKLKFTVTGKVYYTQA